MIAPRPLVSVIISFGDESGSEALERTIRSIEAQSFPSLEVLVCQSAAHNGILAAYSAQRFLPATLEAPEGGAAAWNKGLPLVSGEHVCCLLAGDELAPTYLEKCLFQMEVNGQDAGSAGEEQPDALPHICVVRTRVLDRAGGYDPSRPIGEQRLEFAHRLADLGFAVAEIPEVLARRAGPTVGSGAARPPVAAFASPRRFSYARLVTGWPQHGPAVLLAMPFLTMGGAETTVSRSCRELKRLGFRIFVYTTVPATENQGDATCWFEDSAVGIYHLPNFLDRDHWPAFISYLVQQHGISVLWLVGSSYTYDLLPELRELFPQLAVVDLLFNSVAHAANCQKYNYLIDRVVVEHEGMKAWLLERGEHEDQVTLIPNGVDLDAYSPVPKLDWRTRQQRATAHGRFALGFFGRLSEEKGPDVFLETARLLAANRAIEFLICGTGPMEPVLRRKAAALGLAGRVHFLGFVSTRDYLSCCDAVVVCSRLDGRPNIIMESLAMAVPVVASRVGGIPDMMPRGDEDLLCEPADADAFASAIRLLAGDADRYRRSAAAARRHAEKQFSMKDSGHTYAQLFEELRRRRQVLYRPIVPEMVAASLGYDQNWKPSAPAPAWPRWWRAYSPASWAGHFRNALLLWRVRRSGHQRTLLDQFDAGYYTRQFPVSMEWKPSPFLHYIFFGFREGRNPSPHFNTRYYLSANPDVRRAGLNPLLHYVMWGEREGRFATWKPRIRVKTASL
jgi:O-antigen biosynthesis protein